MFVRRRFNICEYCLLVLPLTVLCQFIDNLVCVVLQVMRNKHRYEVGLEKLAFAASQVRYPLRHLTALKVLSAYWRCFVF